jgi:hypothetical protein
MLADTNERPGVDERYETASNAPDLTLQIDPDLPTRAADVLIAAGWSPVRLGMALMRLHSEWSSAAKPSRLSPKKVAELAARLKAQDDRERENREQGNGELRRLRLLLDQAKGEDVTPEVVAAVEAHGGLWELHLKVANLEHLWATGKLPLPPFVPAEAPAVRAQREADHWFDNELRILANSLKSRAQVWEAALPWLNVHEVPEEVFGAMLLHWLHPVCPKCHGRKFQLIQNTPSLSNRPCPPLSAGGCGGSGIREIPYSQQGRKLANLFDDCVQRARQSIKQRLRRG